MPPITVYKQQIMPVTTFFFFKFYLFSDTNYSNLLFYKAYALLKGDFTFKSECKIYLLSILFENQLLVQWQELV